MDPPLLGVPSVRRLVVTDVISSLGSAMSAVVVAYLAYAKTGSVVLTALAFSGNTLPFVILAPLSARLVTGHDIGHVLAGGQAAKAVLWAGVAIVAATGQLSYVVLLVANFAFGSASALMAAAWPRLAEVVAPPGRLPDLTALFRAIPAGASVLGALIGGVVLVTLGHPWVFAIDAVSYVPLVVALILLPGFARLPYRKGGLLRDGLRFVGRTEALRRAFLLAAVLNLAAFPVLSALPAVAHEIDARGHVLGLLAGAFYAGAALVVWAVVRLRRRFSYSRMLFWGFLAAGLLLLANAALTGWRDPGVDAVTVAVLTLLPIGLAVSLNASLLQALVVLECPNDVKGGVLVLYGAIAAVLTPLGGLMLGVAIDSYSLWSALGGAGLLLTVLALVLRRRLAVFDTLESAGRHEHVASALSNLWLFHLRYIAGADIVLMRHPRPFR